VNRKEGEATKWQITRYKEIKGASGTCAAENGLCSANTDSPKYSYGPR
jgi:hypothetical protein